MKKFISVLLAASMALAMSHALAQSTPTAAKKSAAQTVKKPVKKSAAAKKSAPVKDEDEEDEPDVTGSSVSEYSCGQGHKITVYRNDGDNKTAALRWKNRLYRMTQVETETGAERLEHPRRGLVFIGIPAKALLLDSKKGRQLANDCMLPGQ